MIDYSFFSRVQEYVYFECFLGLDKKKERNLERDFSSVANEAIKSLEEYHLPESYWVDRQLSSKVTNTDVLQTLIQKLQKCIEIKNPFTIDFETMKDYPVEARFFFRVYQRKFDEFAKKLVQINPFSEKSKKHCEWERARLQTCKPPVFEGFSKEYDAWNLSVMKHTYTYLSGALKSDLKKRRANGNLLLRFTYVEDKKKELRKRMIISLASKTAIALGVIYGLRFVCKGYMIPLVAKVLKNIKASRDNTTNNEEPLLRQQ